MDDSNMLKKNQIVLHDMPKTNSIPSAPCSAPTYRLLLRLFGPALTFLLVFLPMLHLTVTLAIEHNLTLSASFGVQGLGFAKPHMSSI
jgi:hypothetical protein